MESYIELVKLEEKSHSWAWEMTGALVIRWSYCVHGQGEASGVKGMRQEAAH